MATITCLALYSPARAPRAARVFGLPYSVSLAGSTFTVPTFGTDARPQITSTLFFFRSPATPPFSCADTPRERFTIACGS